MIKHVQNTCFIGNCSSKKLLKTQIKELPRAFLILLRHWRDNFRTEFSWLFECFLQLTSLTVEKNGLQSLFLKQFYPFKACDFYKSMDRKRFSTSTKPPDMTFGWKDDILLHRKNHETLVKLIDSTNLKKQLNNRI